MKRLVKICACTIVVFFILIFLNGKKGYSLSLKNPVFQDNVTFRIINYDIENGLFQIEVLNNSQLINRLVTPTDITVAVWNKTTDAQGNSQDDLHWYSVQEVDGRYIAEVDLNNHQKVQTEYYIHFYVGSTFLDEMIIHYTKDF